MSNRSKCGKVKLLINVQNESLKIELTCIYFFELFWFIVH